MPIYSFQCNACQQADDRFIRLADYDREVPRQKCSSCGGKMRKLVTVPVLAGLDSGPTGFMRGRVENDGIPDKFSRERIRRNAAKAGTSIEGKTWVPGLCRQGHSFDPFALCSSRDEVIKKARQLGVGVRGPGINVEPTISDAEHAAHEEQDYTPSEQAMKASIVQEIQQNHGGKVTRKKYREIVESLGEKHGQKKQTAKVPDSLFPAEIARRRVEVMP